ncbi:MAG TPA: NIPSNAP family protein [Sphingomicrobium sp.]|nr:NIPSNAP family protein [Sphingomicrobium sp.]
MIVEMRTCQIEPTKVSEYLDQYAFHGQKIQTEHLGPSLGCFSAEMESLDQVIFLWAFMSCDERLRKYERLSLDPQWQAYIALSQPLVVSEEIKLLTPAVAPIPLQPYFDCAFGG